MPESHRLQDIPTERPHLAFGDVHDAIEDLATHFRRHGEPNLASAVERTLSGSEDRLPQRVLALFTHGMGGLMDSPLYRDGVVDREATERRDELAERLHAAAVRALGC
jgi:hypothetical protein